MPRITVLHRGYGCETGCCGHCIEIDDEETEFEFDHPYGEDARKFAENFITRLLGKEHVKDLDWENCNICDD